VATSARDHRGRVARRRRQAAAHSRGCTRSSQLVVVSLPPLTPAPVRWSGHCNGRAAVVSRPSGTRTHDQGPTGGAATTRPRQWRTGGSCGREAAPATRTLPWRPDPAPLPLPLPPRSCAACDAARRGRPAVGPESPARGGGGHRARCDAGLPAYDPGGGSHRCLSQRSHGCWSARDARSAACVGARGRSGLLRPLCTGPASTWACAAGWCSRGSRRALLAPLGAALRARTAVALGLVVAAVELQRFGSPTSDTRCGRGRTAAPWAVLALPQAERTDAAGLAALGGRRWSPSPALAGSCCSPRRPYVVRRRICRPRPSGGRRAGTFRKKAYRNRKADKNRAGCAGTGAGERDVTSPGSRECASRLASTSTPNGRPSPQPMPAADPRRSRAPSRPHLGRPDL
jgi:hypothetical protein